MPKATGRASAPRKTTKAATPVKKKAAPTKKAAPKKAPVAKKKAAPAKKSPAKKAAPVKKAPAAKKSAPAKKAPPPAKKAAAPAAKKAAAPAPVKVAATVKAAAPAKAAPPKVATIPKSLGPVQATYPTKKPPVKRGPDVLDKFALAQQAALQEERLTYVHQAESLQAEADQLAAEREPGDVQFDEESGEGDTLAVERERDLALSFQARAAVDEIDAALAKILEGSYGVCEQCGSNIPRERLRAIPYAALCVQCKSMGLGRR
jgi:RNA polymerase-binding transcription factor DksA